MVFDSFEDEDRDEIEEADDKMEGGEDDNDGGEANGCVLAESRLEATRKRAWSSFVHLAALRLRFPCFAQLRY